MSSSGINLENYLIPLEEINCATENFSQQRFIGGGGFGAVYKGQLCERWQNRTVAVKRLGHDSFQGEHEFRNELQIISRFSHENIISFIGYCDEAKEMILVYDYAINGSLDHHLQDPNKMRCMTWTQRLKICIGAARGLNHLHSGLNDTNRVIHRDVKSANILLDENFVAKMCDFGLSKLGPKNLQNTELFTKVAGTQFYLDPAYNESRILRKESDVYSFGVVLFEMLSGMLVYSKRTTEDDRSEILITSVRRHDQNELVKLVDPDIRVQIHVRSFDMFKEIAYQCISFNYKDRPRMEMVVERIEEALNIQENAGPFIECVMEDMRFSYGKPVAAFTIYKCLLNWNYLETEITTVFDRLIQIFDLSNEDHDNYDKMALWLSNASTLLFLVQKSLKVHGASSVPKLLGRLKMRLRRLSVASVKLAKDNAELIKVVKEVEGKNPAFLFKQQLTTCVDNMYQTICDNMKKDLQALLALSIEASETSVGEDSQLNHWQGIVDFLNTVLNTFTENFVPLVLAQKIFSQIFSYMDVQLILSMLRPNCTSSIVEYMIAGLGELKQWCFEAGQEYSDSNWEKLFRTRVVVIGLIGAKGSMLSISDKTISILLTGIIREEGTLPISVEYRDGNPFYLLYDDSRIPFSFSIDDLSTSLQATDFAKVKPVVELEKYGAFHLKIGRKHIMFGHGIE